MTKAPKRATPANVKAAIEARGRPVLPPAVIRCRNPKHFGWHLRLDTCITLTD